MSGMNVLETVEVQNCNIARNCWASLWGVGSCQQCVWSERRRTNNTWKLRKHNSTAAERFNLRQKWKKKKNIICIDVPLKKIISTWTNKLSLSQSVSCQAVNISLILSELLDLMLNYPALFNSLIVKQQNTWLSNREQAITKCHSNLALPLAHWTMSRFFTINYVLLPLIAIHRASIAAARVPRPFGCHTKFLSRTYDAVLSLPKRPLVYTFSLQFWAFSKHGSKS